MKFTTKPIQVNIPSSQIDEDCNIQDEDQSPNQVDIYNINDKYKGSLLVNNKGRVRDTEKFKLELIDLLTEKRIKRVVMQTEKTNTFGPSTKFLWLNKIPLSEAKSYKSENVREGRAYKMFEEKEDECKWEIIRTPHRKVDSVVDKSQYKLRSTHTPRSVSRKISSRKILKELKP